nr:tetratricopeptide repeat protein [Sporolactobacillus kofuensis]
MEQVQQLIAERKFEQAAKALDLAISEHPEDPAGYTNFGNLLVTMGESPRSFAFFEKALSIDPLYASASFGYGNALFELDRYQEALDRFNEAQKSGLDGGDLFYMIGRSALELGHSGQALAAFQRAVELNDQDLEARFQYALQLARLGDLDTAEQQFHLVIEGDATHADAYYNLGVIAAFQDHNHQAKQYFDRALALNPKHILAANALRTLSEKKD